MAAVHQMKLGNESGVFNGELQPTSINLGSTNLASDVWGVVNSYGASNNNGNLLSQAISAKGMTAAVNQFFGYDALNRVTMGTENPSSSSSPACPDSGSQWCEQFSYDIYGNRTMAQTSFTGLVTPQGFSAATNQITDSGWSYDGSGNVNHDPTVGVSYKYDAENRLVAACGSDAVSTCTNQAGAGRTLYGYDGDGRRVTKQTATGPMIVYVYDAVGQLAAEYGDPTGGGTEYLTADHLGSTRVVTNASMTVVARHDFRPFGDEVTGTAARSGVVGYGTDGAVAQKFTGKERDAETGLDYFGARYMSSAQGRFISTDPFDIITRARNRQHFDEYLGQPQNLNLYAYTWNNPLRFTDPTGETVYVVTYTKGNEEGDDDFRKAAETRANDIRNSTNYNPQKDTVIVAASVPSRIFKASLSRRMAWRSNSAG